MFTSINLMLQRTAHLIYLVRGFLFSLVRNTMGKFIRPELLTVSDEELVQIDFSNPENQLKASKFFIGFTTKQVLNRLAADTVEQRQIKKFYSDVRDFYLSYMFKEDSLCGSSVPCFFLQL